MNKGWTDEQLAARVAAELTDSACVNLGIGMPTSVALHVPASREILFHSENGLIGIGPAPIPGQEDPDIVNAGKQPASLICGASIVHQAGSFSLIRGGRLDVSILAACRCQLVATSPIGRCLAPKAWEVWAELWTWPSAPRRCL